jgi:serine/threonine-protein kinase RIM15
MPGSSFRGSSREDSIGSSLFGDNDSYTNDDIPVVISRKATDNWEEGSGLGITNEETMLEDQHGPKAFMPHLLHEVSAPGRMEHAQLPIRKRSSDKIRNKRQSLEKNRHECADSGDDEDEVLGDTSYKEKSPRGAAKIHRGSKLGTEMMRTNSRGSVVSASDLNSSADTVEPPPTVSEEQPAASHITGATLTPPERLISPGTLLSDMDMDETPRALSSQSNPISDEEPTPRASNSASTSTDYVSLLAHER